MATTNDRCDFHKKTKCHGHFGAERMYVYIYIYIYVEISYIYISYHTYYYFYMYLYKYINPPFHANQQENSNAGGSEPGRVLLLVREVKPMVLLMQQPH